MTRFFNVISFFLLLTILEGLTNVSGQESDDLLDEVARRLLAEGDYVHGAPQPGSRTGSQTDSSDVAGRTSQAGPSIHSCSSADVPHGSCARDGMVCPLAGRHSTYLQCVHSNWLAMPCAPGTMFDMTSKSCASPHDIQPSLPNNQPPPASRTNHPSNEASIQNDSPYGPRMVGFMDFPQAGYSPYNAPGLAGHYPQAGQYTPPAVYPHGASPYQPAGQSQGQTGHSIGQATPAPKDDHQASKESPSAAKTEDGHITQDDSQVCRIGTYRAVPGSKKYYEHCIHSGSQSSQWMRRLCPPGMVADENPVELPCRFSLNFAPAKQNYNEQDTKPKSPITAPYNYKFVPQDRKADAGVPSSGYVPSENQYVPVKQANSPKHNQPIFVYYYQPSKKQETPVEQTKPWKPNAAVYSPNPASYNPNAFPYQPNQPDEQPDERDPFKNGGRVVHNVDTSPYNTNRGVREQQNQYNVDWSQSGRQGNVNPDEGMNQQPIQPEIPSIRVVTEYVTFASEPTTLPTTQRTEPTTPVTLPKQQVTLKETESPATAPPVPSKPEPKEVTPKKPTQVYPNYLDNANFMKILKDLAAKYIENVPKGQNSTLNDKPTEESVTADPEVAPETNVELPNENEGNPQTDNTMPNPNVEVEVPRKGNDVIIDVDSGRYELPFIVDIDDLVLWPRDVAAGGEKTEADKSNHANPFYLLKLPNTAASSNEAAALAAGLNSLDSDS